MNIKDKKEIENKRKKAKEIANLMKVNLFDRDEFTKYKYFESSKTAHLNLVITEPFFENLNSEQVDELDILVTKLSKYPYNKGKMELTKSSFWN